MPSPAVRPVPDDAATLVDRARAGSRQACAALLREVSPRIQRTVWFMGGGAEAEDLVQAVYVQVLQSLRGFRGESSFATWVDRITVRTLLRHRRSLATRPPAAPLDEERLAGPGGAGAGEARLALGVTLELLERIAERRRTALVLHMVHGHSTAEVAEIMGCTRVTAKALLLRGKQDLIRLGSREPRLRELLGQRATEAAS